MSVDDWDFFQSNCKSFQWHFPAWKHIQRQLVYRWLEFRVRNETSSCFPGGQISPGSVVWDAWLPTRANECAAHVFDSSQSNPNRRRSFATTPSWIPKNQSVAFCQLTRQLGRFEFTCECRCIITGKPARVHGIQAIDVPDIAHLFNDVCGGSISFHVQQAIVWCFRLIIFKIPNVDNTTLLDSSRCRLIHHPPWKNREANLTEDAHQLKFYIPTTGLDLTFSISSWCKQKATCCRKDRAASLFL